MNALAVIDSHFALKLPTLLVLGFSMLEAPSTLGLQTTRAHIYPLLAINIVPSAWLYIECEGLDLYNLL